MKLVCKFCGRIGTRAFVVWRGQENLGQAEWACEHRSACEKRQRRARWQ